MSQNAKIFKTLTTTNDLPTLVELQPQCLTRTRVAAEIWHKSFQSSA